MAHTASTSPTAPDIQEIVRQVIHELRRGVAGNAGPTAPQSAAASIRTEPSSHAGRHGVFDSVDEAVTASQAAFEQLEKLGMEGRRKAIAHIRRISIDDAEELGRMEF